MKTCVYSGVLSLSAVALAAAGLVVACGGGGSSNGGGTPPAGAKATAIDAAGVTSSIPTISRVLPVCSAGPAKAAGKANSPAVSSALLDTVMQVPQIRRAASTLVARQAAATKPADKLGPCGGRITYPDFSHANGTTTATLAFENYCSNGTTAGVREIVNGRIAYVDIGTPTASGPVRTKLTANSPAGLTVISRDAADKVLNSQLTTFTNFNSVVGVPGGSATQAHPDTVGIDEITIVDTLANKTYRQTGLNMSQFETANGRSQVTLSGRGYRSNGDYFDFSTLVPVVENSSGNTVSGTLEFKGAGGSVAVATLVPGTVNQATVTVNGVAVTGLPACK